MIGLARATLLGATSSPAGSIIKTFSSPGSNPQGLAWTGVSLGVSDASTEVLYLVNPETGNSQVWIEAVVASDITWDGSSLWVCDFALDALYQLSSAGLLLDQINLDTNGIYGLAYADGTLWVADDGNNEIIAVNPANSEVTNSWSSPGMSPRGLTWDGSTLWHADGGTATIYRLDPSDGSTLASFAAPASNPTGLTWDGEALWVADNGTDTLYQVAV